MNSSGQKEFIGNIGRALGDLPKGRKRPLDFFSAEISDVQKSLLEQIKNRSSRQKQALLDRLIEMGKPINLNVIAQNDGAAVTEAIAGLVEAKEPEWGSAKSVVAWRHPLIDRLNLAGALAEQNVPVYFTELENDAEEASSKRDRRERLRQQVIDSYIGVTSADFCMADTATLVMRARPGQARSVSLAPSIHVAVIELGQIIADLKELYALLKWEPGVREEGLTNCMTFISGPSKTADIEATMVHGAHGPREVYIYVITD